MKLFTLITILCSCFQLTFGQGLIQFNNRVIAFSIDAPIYVDEFGGVLASGTNYYAQLWGGPSIDELYPTTPIVTFREDAPGYVNVGVEQSRAITNVNYGQLAYVQIRAWTSSSGQDWNNILQDANVKFGVSSILPIQTPGFLSPPAPMVGLDSFVITAIPELNIGTMLVFGGIILLLCKARKHDTQ